MSLRVAWNHAALVTFYALAPHEAMAVRFAVDRATGIMNVLYLYRVR